MLTGVAIDHGTDVVLLTITGLRGLLDRFLHRANDDAAVDRLFLGNGLRDLKNFEPVG